MICSGQSEWLLNSTATYHVCTKRECFFSYEKLDTGVVLMGNDNPCRTVEIGTIRFKLHDEMIMELTEVRHIPDMTHNLISLGMLESKGFKVILEDGVSKVLHGALVIIARRSCEKLILFEG